MNVQEDVLQRVSRETIAMLEDLLALTEKWNPAINLVAKSTLSNGWARHIQDSAQLFSMAPVRDDLWVDIGSGAGYPGLVIAILSRELAPGRRVTLVESDQRKATFLRQASRSLTSSVSVVVQRIEQLDPMNADVLTARALAPLDVLCGFAHRHLRPGGVAIFPKGGSHEQEVLAARKTWNFDLVSHPSRTEPSAAVLELRSIAHV